MSNGPSSQPNIWDKTIAHKCGLDDVAPEGAKHPDVFDSLEDEQKQQLQDVFLDFNISAKAAAEIAIRIDRIITSRDTHQDSTEPSREAQQKATTSGAGIAREGMKKLIYFWEDLARPPEPATIRLEDMVSRSVVLLHGCQHFTTTNRTQAELAKIAGVSVPTFIKWCAECGGMVGKPDLLFHRAPEGKRASEAPPRTWKSRAESGKRPGPVKKLSAQDIERVLPHGESMKESDVHEGMMKNGVRHTTAYNLRRKHIAAGDLVRLSGRRIMWRPPSRAAVPKPSEILAQDGPEIPAHGSL